MSQGSGRDTSSPVRTSRPQLETLNLPLSTRICNYERLGPGTSDPRPLTMSFCKHFGLKMRLFCSFANPWGHALSSPVQFVRTRSRSRRDRSTWLSALGYSPCLPFPYCVLSRTTRGNSDARISAQYLPSPVGRYVTPLTFDASTNRLSKQ